MPILRDIFIYMTVTGISAEQGILEMSNYLNPTFTNLRQRFSFKSPPFSFLDSLMASLRDT